MKEKNHAQKMARIPIKVVPSTPLQKPDWIRVKAGTSARFAEIKTLLREKSLHTVCEEASCPNIGECFGRGTATFLILGNLCTRRCPFCDVAHGKPFPPDAAEPLQIASSVAALSLHYAVVTSVNRDDLRDGGAAHFAAVIAAIRSASPKTKVEILVPDFRGKLEEALDVFEKNLPDVFNHNLETVPRLYQQVRPGADYTHSLKLMAAFKARYPHIVCKSGLMVGLGESDDEILEVLVDLRAHGVDSLTIGQYLSPSAAHLPVSRYVPPEIFQYFEHRAIALGFSAVAAAPMVRSSYWAERHGSGD